MNLVAPVALTTTFGSLCWEEMKEYKWAESEVLYMMAGHIKVTSFPGLWSAILETWE